MNNEKRDRVTDMRRLLLFLLLAAAALALPIYLLAAGGDGGAGPGGMDGGSAGRPPQTTAGFADRASQTAAESADRSAQTTAEPPARPERTTTEPVVRPIRTTAEPADRPMQSDGVSDGSAPADDDQLFSAGVPPVFGDAISMAEDQDGAPVLRYAPKPPDDPVGGYAPNGNILITISAIGDCTIGYDESFGQGNRFDQVYAANGHNPAYFFENVLHILSDDDITVANLETVFTNAAKKASKAYRFKGPPEYARILEEGSVEVVNLANNHMFDYYQKGYDDTVETLNASTVGHFGYDEYHIEEIRGVKIGFAGFHIGAGGWGHRKQSITNALEKLRPQVDLLVLSYHWGVEGKYTESADQRSLARFSIDNGADLVLGHHPHTLQPIEIYKERAIAYSLGNFVFGGNRNPKDKDSIILRQSFEFDAESRHLEKIYEPEVIPVSISSVADRNDYRPTPVEGAAAVRISGKLKY